MIRDDDNDAGDSHVKYNRLITKMDERFDDINNEEQAQQVYVIRDNDNNKVTPKIANAHDVYMTHVSTHPANIVVQFKKYQQNNNNKNN